MIHKSAKTYNFNKKFLKADDLLLLLLQKNCFSFCADPIFAQVGLKNSNF